jgi:hypothetical protein
MEKSRKAAAINTTPYECGEGELPDNFRPYDQGQDFFVNVSKKPFWMLSILRLSSIVL